MVESPWKYGLDERFLPFRDSDAVEATSLREREKAFFLPGTVPTSAKVKLCLTLSGQKFWNLLNGDSSQTMLVTQ